MIKIFDVSKSFKGAKALKNVSLEVDSGEILGIIGENGAGKSTLLGILSTVLKPDSGSVFINNIDLLSEPEKIRKIVGILFGSELGLYERLTARENLEFFAMLNGLSGEKLKNRIDFLSDKFSFREYLDKQVLTLSKGMKQKVAIAKAVVHDPAVMLFDEPESGLDFKASKIVLNFIEECKKEGKSVIFSSHSLENIKNYSDRVAVIRKGEIVKVFSIKEYREKYSEKQINEIILNWICEADENDY